MLRTLFLISILCISVFSQSETQIDFSDTTTLKTALKTQEELSTLQFKAIQLHKILAFTTGGLLLASDGIGLYHFLSMREQGHKFRDEHGFNEENLSNSDIPSTEIKTIWRKNESQSERVIHAALITASTISYTATATIELTLPSMNNDPSYQKRVTLHRASFFTHASLMAANIGLGLAESHALSKGHHNAVMPLGIAHLVVGFAAPVIMFGSGLIFSI